jgi:catechol 2,3-dioxygenase-like lactoylglutathione lyase family enzyme
MMNIMKSALTAILLLGLAGNSSAQLAAPGPSGVSMGHVHLNTKDPDAQKRFWVDVIGAVDVIGSEKTKLAFMQAFKMPGVLILLRKTDPAGGTDGSVVNHIAVKVRDLSETLAKVEAAHFQVVSKNPPQAMLLGPDGVRVELTEDKALAQPVVFHHVHFYTTKVDEMKKWYVATFGAIGGKRGRFEAADLPGVNLTFAPTENPPVGTKGRAIDHIGFEVKDLEAFAKKLEAAGIKFDVAYRKVPGVDLAFAFLTDPFGTYIELTEGLWEVGGGR